MTRNRSWSASLSSLLSSKSSTAVDSKKERERLRRDTFTSFSDAHIAGPSDDSPPPPNRVGFRPSSRPVSMLQPYQPPTVEIERETLPELQPIFNFMNNHSQRLYTEGYFLKLTDLLPDGKLGHDRSWQECFGQLRGTVLSLWNAQELDQAGPNQEVVPTFLNLTDASIKMIDSLPTRASGAPPVTNILSISTAGRNRYLFHFNSHHSLVQWTAGIRLCMFEHSKLQEIYTGALIASKGRDLNGIKEITDRTRFKYEDWVRVRFGAGTPWKKCWAVITQPDEKMVKKAKAAAKKANKTAYPQIPVFKGDIKFYDSKKTKKQQPIATMVDAFAAYALYPQSKNLIDHSSLLKIEGKIKIHGDQPTESEGFVFVMPDIHPAVSGFEIMLRFLFPLFDTFALYGRPGMLIPDKMDMRSLMFAMPRDGSRDCGYLEVQDVANLIVSKGADLKFESQWRGELKVATQEKIKTLQGTGRPRTSLPAGTKLNVNLGSDSHSSASLPLHQLDLPPQHVPLRTPPASAPSHHRSASEATAATYRGQSRPPTLLNPVAMREETPPTRDSDNSSDEGLFQGHIDPAARHLQAQTQQPDPDPVPVTPVSTRLPSSRPPLPLPGARQEDEDNLFAGVVPLRSVSSVQEPAPAAYSPPPKQIAQRQSRPPLEAPPGFALQSSHVLLRGPRPTGDKKAEYDDEYANQPPPGRPASSQYDMPPPPPPPPNRQQWVPQPPPVPTHGSKYQQGNGNGLSSPPIPAKIPVAAPSNLPPINTHVDRKPVPAPVSAESPTETPEEIRDLAAHLIDEGALDRIGTRRPPAQQKLFYQHPDEDTLDRKAMQRIQRVLAGGDSDSEYEEETDDEPDYASVDSDKPPPRRNADLPRAGRMKVVGKEPEPEVVIGDVHYRPQSSGKQLDEKTIVPKIDFGATINHGRSLSAELKKGDQHPASQHGSLIGGDNRRLSSYSPSNDHRRSPSSGGSNEDRKRESWARPTPERGNSGNSQGSDGDNVAKRRSMVWQPGMAHVGGATSAEGAATPEQYVAERFAAAQNQTRSRYVHQRRSSGQLLNSGSPSPAGKSPSAEHLPARPPSRGGNAAFMPHGLVSTPDLSQHLSAREQEFVARKTGSSLVHVEGKPTPRAGLIGAIQSRETERQTMKEAWNRGQVPNNLTVQQEIARREQEKAQRERTMKTTPSPRPLSMSFEQQQQQGYFPPQPIAQQQYGYGGATYGMAPAPSVHAGQQSLYHGNAGYQGSYYGRQ